MQTSRRNFIKSTGVTSALLGAGGILPGFLAASCHRKKDVDLPYYDQEIITVCKSDKDLPRHSEASIIELKDSTLLMAWQRHERSQFGGGDQAPSTISLMNSSDGGRTWGNFRIAAKRLDENSVNVYSPNFLRLKNGDILLLYMEYIQLEGGKPQLSTAYTIRSRDEGQTFSQPVPAWERFQGGFSNSCMIRLSSGRVIIPMQHTAGNLWAVGEQGHVRVFYSDDDCSTWVMSQKNISLPMRGAMEPFVAELKDGRLIMVMRNQLGSVFKSYSADRGENWSLPQTTGLRAPESCPNVTNIPGSDKIMVIWNNSEYNPNWRSHYGKRSPLTAAISADGGVTFTDFWDIETDPDTAFTNPGITWTRDGVCLLTYWVCPYNEKGGLDVLKGIDLRLARFRVRV